MGFPRGVLPPKVKTWEWSAVTTVRVSDSLVSWAARWMALSNITVSVNASFATLSWWPWSILPRAKEENNPNESAFETLRQPPFFPHVVYLKYRFYNTHLPQTGSSLSDSCWGSEWLSLSSPRWRDPACCFGTPRISCPLARTDLEAEKRKWENRYRPF